MLVGVEDFRPERRTSFQVKLREAASQKTSTFLMCLILLLNSALGKMDCVQCPQCRILDRREGKRPP